MAEIELRERDVLENFLDYDVSVWISEANSYRPSTKFKILKKLPPNVYTVDFDRDYGITVNPLDIVSDSLIHFEGGAHEKIIPEIIDFWEKKSLYEANNLVHKRGILLMGYPGSGKTSIIKMVSKSITKLGGLVFFINDARSLEVYVNFLKYHFRKIEPNTFVMTVLEEIDKYNPIEDSLLNFLDGSFSIDHHVVLATTNNSENIPNSLLRPSRMDLLIEVNFPDESQRREFLASKNIKEENLDYMAKNSDGFSFADLKDLFVSTALLNYSIDAAIDKIKNPLSKKDYSKNSKSSGKVGF